MFPRRFWSPADAFLGSSWVYRVGLELVQQYLSRCFGCICGPTAVGSNAWAILQDRGADFSSSVCVSRANTSACSLPELNTASCIPQQPALTPWCHPRAKLRGKAQKAQSGAAAGTKPPRESPPGPGPELPMDESTQVAAGQLKGEGSNFSRETFNIRKTKVKR